MRVGWHICVILKKKGSLDTEIGYFCSQMAAVYKAIKSIYFNKRVLGESQRHFRKNQIRWMLFL